MDRKSKEHWEKLERMYHGAVVNEWFRPKMVVSEGRAEIEMAADPKFFHAAGALHGAIYFKMLDDAAFFAANSVIFDVFALTTNFTINFLRPVSKGMIKSVGELVSSSQSSFISESRLYDEKESLIAVGLGTFVKSKVELCSLDSYK